MRGILPIGTAFVKYNNNENRLERTQYQQPIWHFERLYVIYSRKLSKNILNTINKAKLQNICGCDILENKLQVSSFRVNIEKRLAENSFDCLHLQTRHHANRKWSKSNAVKCTAI